MATEAGIQGIEMGSSWEPGQLDLVMGLRNCLEAQRYPMARAPYVLPAHNQNQVPRGSPQVGRDARWVELE